jgi:hypothetical protein
LCYNSAGMDDTAALAELPGRPPDAAEQVLLDLLDLAEDGYGDAQLELSETAPDSAAWHYQVGRGDAYDHLVEVLKDALQQHLDGIR